MPQKEIRPATGHLGVYFAGTRTLTVDHLGPVGGGASVPSTVPLHPMNAHLDCDQVLMFWLIIKSTYILVINKKFKIHTRIWAVQQPEPVT